MIRAALLAFAQLSDPRVRRVLWLSLAATIASLVAVVAIAWAALLMTSVFGIPWLDGALDVLGGLASVVLAVLLFPAVVGMVSGFFLDSVTEAVEARHYPGLPAAKGQSVLSATLTGLRFLGVMVALNILVLPLYLVPVLNLFIFYGLNGYLLGREYFELMAFRRLGEAEGRALWRRRRPRFLAAGVLIAALSSVPVLNLLAPVLATAFVVHVYEGIRREDQASGMRP